MQTIDEIKSWLARGIGVNAEINALIEARDKAYEQCTSITSNLTGMTVDGSRNPHKFDRYLELENIIDAKIDELVGIKAEILGAVNKLQNGAQRTVLTERYINCKSWEEIADALGYEVRNVYRRHGEALLELLSLCQ